MIGVDVALTQEAVVILKSFVAMAALAAMEPSSQKVVPDLRAVMVPAYVDRVTSCVGTHVAASANYGKQALPDLITEKMAECAQPARELVEIIDDCFGKGVGEQYFLGAYLDTLPRRLEVWIRKHAEK